MDRSRMKVLFEEMWQLTDSQKRNIIAFVKAERASERAKALREVQKLLIERADELLEDEKRSAQSTYPETNVSWHIRNALLVQFGKIGELMEADGS